MYLVGFAETVVGLYGESGFIVSKGFDIRMIAFIALIYGIYTGRWAIAPEVMAKLADPEQIAGHDPSEYYLRINFTFETAVENAKVAWMNRLIAIATGRRVADGIDYRVFEIT